MQIRGRSHSDDEETFLVVLESELLKEILTQGDLGNPVALAVAQLTYREVGQEVAFFLMSFSFSSNSTFSRSHEDEHLRRQNPENDDPRGPGSG